LGQSLNPFPLDGGRLKPALSAVEGMGVVRYRQWPLPVYQIA